jgi:hypothetical protein
MEELVNSRIEAVSLIGADVLLHNSANAPNENWKIADLRHCISFSGHHDRGIKKSRKKDTC